MSVPVSRKRKMAVDAIKSLVNGIFRFLLSIYRNLKGISRHPIQDSRSFEQAATHCETSMKILQNTYLHVNEKLKVKTAIISHKQLIKVMG